MTQAAMDNDTMVAVTQEDRDAAASYGANGVAPHHFTEGQCDDHPLVQAFARYRNQSGRTRAGEALREALAKIMPITFDDGPDYMSLYFGDGSGAHSTQAMTMHPQDWYDLQTAYEAALPQSTAGEDGT